MTDTCPECGCPINGETICPDCGFPLPQDESKASEDFNEDERYSPFKSDGWFFSAPYPISRYPKRGDLAKKHPFVGWLFQAWHISYKGNGNKNTIDALNNLFLIFNLQWKLFLFPVVWVFFKLLWWIVAVVGISIFLPIILDATKTSQDVMSVIMMTWFSICSSVVPILFILGCILYFCGFAESFRRYWPALYESFMRLCKRFSLSIKKSIQTNDINE